MKENFLLKKAQGEIFEELGDEDAGKLIKGIFKYVITGDSGLKGYLKAVFISIKEDIDENEKKYKKRCETNRANATKGGAPKGNKNAKTTENNPKQPKTTQNNPKTNENNQTSKKTTQNNVNNHIYIHNNHLEDKKDIRGMGEEEKEETFNQESETYSTGLVSMTNVEYEELVSTYGKEFTDRCIEKLSNYKGSTGKEYESDHYAIKSWVVDAVKNSMKNTTDPPEWFNKKQETNELSENEYAEMEKILSDIGCEVENVKT